MYHNIISPIEHFLDKVTKKHHKHLYGDKPPPLTCIDYIAPHLVIAAYGPFQHWPLCAVQASPTKAPLLSRFSITYVPSLVVFENISRRLPLHPHMLAQRNGNLAASVIRNPTRDLANADQEADNIKAHIDRLLKPFDCRPGIRFLSAPSSITYRNKDEVISTIVETAESPYGQFVHFACHSKPHESAEAVFDNLKRPSLTELDFNISITRLQYVNQRCEILLEFELKFEHFKEAKG